MTVVIGILKFGHVINIKFRTGINERYEKFGRRGTENRELLIQICLPNVVKRTK